ncbi:glycosyltransferase, partial [Rhizobium phaseoli]
MQTTVEPIRGTNDPVQSLELSLVVPVFNEEESVGPLVERILAAMGQYPH